MFKLKESAMFALAMCVLAIFVGLVRFGIPTDGLIAACIAIFAGSFAPNLDTPFIHVRRHLKLVSFACCLAIMLYLYFWLGGRIMGLCNAEFGAANCTAGTFALIVITPFLVATLVDTVFPFKSGPLHGFVPAFLFGALVFVYLIGTKGLLVSGYAACCGFFAYMVHVILDNDYY